jgi:NitT/TauT family transport system substrate-binding protein
MTFQDDLQRAGLDPAAIAGRRVRPMAANVRAFLRGTVDVIQVFEPHADRLVSEGRGHVWHRFSERGDVVYTTFYATRRFTRARREACRRLVRGMARAQTALSAATPRAVADAVAPFLPELSRDALTRIVGAYRASGLWARTPDLPPAPYLRLKAALVSGGLIRSDPSYDRLVDAALSRAD